MATYDTPESEDFHSLPPNDTDDDSAQHEGMEPPTHPVPALQAAFEESIVESTADDDLPRRPSDRDAEARRQKLLSSKQYDSSQNSRWNQKPYAQHHPLAKLLAQIIFGMHLLQQEQAKSDQEVVKILQTHVNEVDCFLERTSEDFELAIKDIEERIRFLNLPMKHLEVFNTMLDEKKFRTQLLDGNEKIEGIISRTTEAMNAALLDIQTGLDVNKELSRYLNSIHDAWPRGNKAISDVFGAMRGNEQGWTGYLRDLQGKGRELWSNLARLGQVIAEMSRLAAAASRRNKAQRDKLPPSGAKSAPNSPGLRSKFTPDATPPPLPSSPLARSASLNKPLPKEPQIVAGAAQVGKANGVHPVPFAERFEKPRNTPQSPDAKKLLMVSNAAPVRPKLSDGAVRRKQARAANERQINAELIDFLKHSSLLGSNPPETMQNPLARTPERKPVRSQSQGTNLMLDTRVPERKKNGSGRSLSQGAVETAPKAQSKPGALPAISENQKPAAYQPNGPQSPPRRSAFARRLSRRMRHINSMDVPTADQAQSDLNQYHNFSSSTSEKAASPPVDSAYEASIEKPSVPGEPSEGGGIEQDQRANSRGFALFPKVTEPTTPVALTPVKQPAWADDHKSTATSMSKGRSLNGLRKYFHLRKGSGMGT